MKVDTCYTIFGLNNTRRDISSTDYFSVFLYEITTESAISFGGLTRGVPWSNFGAYI